MQTILIYYYNEHLAIKSDEIFSYNMVIFLGISSKCMYNFVHKIKIASLKCNLI